MYMKSGKIPSFEFLVGMKVDIVECRGLLTDVFRFRIFYHHGTAIKLTWDRNEIKQINTIFLMKSSEKLRFSDHFRATEVTLFEFAQY